LQSRQLIPRSQLAGPVPAASAPARNSSGPVSKTVATSSASHSLSLDVPWVREQFPAFSHPAAASWAHLENAGGSYVPRQVTDLLTDFFVATKVQPYYGFAPSVAAGEAMDRAKALLPATLNAPAGSVTFGPSTSANTYVLAHALRPTWSDGDEVIVTNQDHEANIGSWRRLETTGLVVKEWQVDPVTGLLDIADLKELITARTKLVAVTHASNIVATLNPVREIADLVHGVGGLVVVDGVSHAPHAAVDVVAIDCDVYLYSAYKTFGPHVGIMYAKAAVLSSVANQGHYFKGGEDLTYKLTPAGPNHAEIAATAGILDYYAAVYQHHIGSADGVDPVEVVRAVFALFAAHEQQLMTPLGEFLASHDGVRLVGTASTDHALRAPTFAFSSARRSSADIYQALIAAEVSCGYGNFYAYRLMQALGLDPEDGTVRLSLVHYNVQADVDRALEVLDTVL
jgi:cysteine desulfurase family protein (TIGR01976 family)